MNNMTEQEVCDMLREKSLLTEKGISLVLNGDFVSLNVTAITAIVNAAIAAPVQAKCDSNTQGMADCMDMVHQELIEAGIIGKDVAPMFVANAVVAHIKSLQAPVQAAVVPDGYVLAPAMPNQPMRDAGNRTLRMLQTEAGMGMADRAYYVYRSMIEEITFAPSPAPAAPSPAPVQPADAALTLLQDAACAWNNEREAELDAIMERVEVFLLQQKNAQPPQAQQVAEAVPVAGRCVTLTGECQCEDGQQEGCVSWRRRPTQPTAQAAKSKMTWREAIREVTTAQAAPASQVREALELMVERFGPCEAEYIFSKRLAIQKARAALAHKPASGEA